MWVGLTTPTEELSTWNSSPPSPKDNFDEENDYWDSMLSMLKLDTADLARVVRRYSWTSGTVYDMYRHDYSRNNPSNVTGSTHLYDSRNFVVNSDYRDYICLHNGTDPDNVNGKQSLSEPTFVDLEPRCGSDGYVWKYLFTISPSDVVKFQTNDYIPLPSDWSITPMLPRFEIMSVSGQLKVVTITGRGVGYGTAELLLEFQLKGWKRLSISNSKRRWKNSIG